MANKLLAGKLYLPLSPGAKKMIVSPLIRRGEVSKGYKVHVESNLDFQHTLTRVESDTKEIVA